MPIGTQRAYLQFDIRRVQCKKTGKVRQENLPWLSQTTRGYTRRFALYVGRRCQESSIKAVALELVLDWKTAKELEKEYLAEKLKQAGQVNPEVIGIDEISVRKGHQYRIVVSDLERRRPVWVGGADRSKESMDQFYLSLEAEMRQKIRLAVMDMWKAFEQSAREYIPQAAILYDKFHVLRHLGEAVDKTRVSEYSRVGEKDRRYIKGQRYTLLSHRRNLDLNGQRALKELLRVNHRLNTAYLLKESFGELWSYESAGWARKFFDNWKASLKWQRLKPFEQFAKMIEKHWDGIAAYCNLKEKVSLGFVEGLNNKIRVIQRRAYGLRDEEYFRLKVLTCTLPEIDPFSPT